MDLTTLMEDAKQEVEGVLEAFKAKLVAEVEKNKAVHEALVAAGWQPPEDTNVSVNVQPSTSPEEPDGQPA